MSIGVLAFLIALQDPAVDRERLFRSAVGEPLASRLRKALPELKVGDQDWEKPEVWRQLYLVAAPEQHDEAPGGLRAAELLKLFQLAMDASEGLEEIDEIAFRAVEGGLLGAAPRIAGLLGHPDGDIPRRALTRLGELGEPAVASEIVPLLESRDPETVVEAIGVLVRLRWPGLAGWCRRLLFDERDGVPDAALRALQERGDRASLADVFSLLDHPDEQRRSAAIEAAAALGGRAVLPRLRGCLADRGGEVRAAAVRMLARLRDDASLPDLRRMLDDPYPAVRAAVVNAFDGAWPAERRRVLPALGDADLHVRNQALSAVRWSRLEAARPVLARLLPQHAGESYFWETIIELGIPEAAPLVLERLKDVDPLVRRRASHEAVALGAAAALPELLAQIRQQDPQLRAEGWEGLRRLASPEALAALRTLLKAEEPFLRSGAADVLAAKQDGPSMPMLLGLTMDADPGVVVAAARALFRLGHPRGTELLAGLVTSPRDDHRSEAVWTLIDADRPELLPLLRKALAHPSPHGLWRTIEALGERRDRDSAAPIALHLAHPDVVIRRAAVVALVGIGAERHAPLFRPLLAADHEDLRAAGLAALAAAGDLASLPRVRRLLTDPSAWVRRAAAQALGDLDDGASGAELAERLDDDDPLVREAAVRALAKLGRIQAAPALEARVRDESRAVRRAAVEALGDLDAPGARRAAELLLAIEGGDVDTCASAWRAGHVFEGTPPLEGAERNALRRPAVWKRLLRSVWIRPPDDSIGEALERMAKEADLTLIWPRPLPAGIGRSQWGKSYSWSGRPGPQPERRARMIDALIASAGCIGLELVLEDDRLLLLSPEAARDFWNHWSEEERRR